MTHSVNKNSEIFKRIFTLIFCATAYSCVCLFVSRRGEEKNKIYDLTKFLFYKTEN